MTPKEKQQKRMETFRKFKEKHPDALIMLRCGAAIRSNRHYIGFELSEEYHKTCIKRIKSEAQEQTLF